MSEPRDPAQVPAASSSSQAEGVEAGLVTAEQKNQRLALEPIQVVEGQQRISTPLVFENLQVLTHFLTGALFLGGDELVQRLRYFQREVRADPQRLPALAATDQETTGDLLRYLALGLFPRGQKRVARGLHRGVYVSLGVSKVDRRRAGQTHRQPAGSPGTSAGGSAVERTGRGSGPGPRVGQAGGAERQVLGRPDRRGCH